LAVYNGVKLNRLTVSKHWWLESSCGRLGNITPQLFYHWGDCPHGVFTYGSVWHSVIFLDFAFSFLSHLLVQCPAV